MTDDHFNKALDELAAVVAADPVLRRKLLDAIDDGPLFAKLAGDALVRRDLAGQN